MKNQSDHPSTRDLSPEFLLVQSDMSESQRIVQLSGGGDDVGVSSFRRRRRLSSAVFGSPSSSSTAPSSSFSFRSVSEAVVVKSPGSEGAVAPLSCSELEESLFFSLSRLGVLVLPPAAGLDDVWFVSLASPVAASVRGGVSVATVVR